jgi:hypothetical protein
MWLVDLIQEGPVVNCYEWSNEPSGSIKFGHVIYCWFVKQDSVVWL